MMDRFLNDEIEISIEERPGCKFIMCAQQVYIKLNQIQSRYNKKSKNEMKSLFAAIDDAIRSYNHYEKLREKFKVPLSMRDAYFYAERHYASIKRNPEGFYKKEEVKRLDLAKEREKLIIKIKNLEIELSRSEDQVRIDANDLYSKLTAELEHLVARKKQYETHEAAAKKNYFPLCSPHHQEKVANVLKRIDDIQSELKHLKHQRHSGLEEMSERLNSMNARRWEIDKELLALENKPSLRMIRWQAAIDQAEIQVNVRRLDIEAAANRHYGSYTQQPMHAFLNVYGWLMVCVQKMSGNVEALSEDLGRLPQLADALYCPDLTNRSVETLYKKLQSLPDIDRNEIISKKPTMNHLPEELLRTFAVSYLRDSTDLMKMFNDTFPSNPLMTIPRFK